MGNKRAVSVYAWIAIPVLIFFITEFPMPIYTGLWTNIFALDIAYLGYIFLAIGIIAAVAYFIPKSGNWKLNFYILTIFCFMIAIRLLWPYWYATNWFA